MAKIKVLGDTIQLVSEVKTEVIERAAQFNPDCLKLKDEEGNELFSIGLGHASITKYGVNFCSTNASGYAFVTTTNSVIDHSNPEVEKEILKREWAPTLYNLRIIEAQINEAQDLITTMEESIIDSIELN